MSLRRYDDWKRAVDAYMLAHWGVTSDDIPDFNYRDYFEDSASPSFTARAAIRNAQEY